MHTSADSTSTSLHTETSDDGETTTTIVEDITFDKDGNKTSEHRETTITDRRKGKTIVDIATDAVNNSMHLTDTTRRDLQQSQFSREERNVRPSANTSIFGIVILLGLILAVFIAYKFFIK